MLRLNQCLFVLNVAMCDSNVAMCMHVCGGGLPRCLKLYMTCHEVLSSRMQVVRVWALTNPPADCY